MREFPLEKANDKMAYEMCGLHVTEIMSLEKFVESQIYRNKAQFAKLTQKEYEDLLVEDLVLLEFN